MIELIIYFLLLAIASIYCALLRDTPELTLEQKLNLKLNRIHKR